MHLSSDGQTTAKENLAGVAGLTGYPIRKTGSNIVKSVIY
ncbi:hypothetical protein D083_2264 [Dickeya solani RNS 08.23.3.1.A]|nr:hypothetical protein D083_2264 [Dickeya solani RNS 08.23.3.1.A]